MSNRNQPSNEELRRNIADNPGLDFYAKSKPQLMRESINDFNKSIPKIGNQAAFTMEDIAKLNTNQRNEVPASTQRRITEFLDNLNAGGLTKETKAILDDLKNGNVPDIRRPGMLSTLAGKAERTILEWANKVPDMDSVPDRVYDAAMEALEGASKFMKAPDLTDSFRNAGRAIQRVVTPAMEVAAKEIMERAAVKVPVVGWAVGAGVVVASGSASASEARTNGATAREATEVGAMRGAMETASAFDPTIIGSMSAEAMKDLSLEYRLGLTNSLIAKMADGALSSSGNGLLSGNAVSTGLAVAGMALERMNDREVTITTNGIDRQQKQILDGNRLPDTLRINNQDVPLHIALRDPRAFNAMHGHLSSNNQRGEFNEELRDLNQFAALERRRDTIIDRAEARGDLNTRTADQLQNGTNQQSIRTGMTFTPGGPGI